MPVNGSITGQTAWGGTAGIALLLSVYLRCLSSFFPSLIHVTPWPMPPPRAAAYALRFATAGYVPPGGHAGDGARRSGRARRAARRATPVARTRAAGPAADSKRCSPAQAGRRPPQPRASGYTTADSALAAYLKGAGDEDPQNRRIWASPAVRERPRSTRRVPWTRVMPRVRRTGAARREHRTGATPAGRAALGLRPCSGWRCCNAGGRPAQARTGHGQRGGQCAGRGTARCVRWIPTIALAVRDWNRSSAGSIPLPLAAVAGTTPGPTGQLALARGDPARLAGHARHAPAWRAPRRRLGGKRHGAGAFGPRRGNADLAEQLSARPGDQRRPGRHRRVQRTPSAVCHHPAPGGRWRQTFLDRSGSRALVVIPAGRCLGSAGDEEGHHGFEPQSSGAVASPWAAAKSRWETA